MEMAMVIRILCILIIIVGTPPITYFIYILYKSARKKRICASWEDIKKHISLDEMEEKTKKWKEEGYKVDELEEMLEETK